MEDEYIGKKYNRLTVLSYSHTNIMPSGRKDKRYLCQCECGITKEFSISRVVSGATKSCGCLRKEIQENRLCDEMIGRTFGRLTVLSKAPSAITPKGKVYSKWHCLCECGNEVDVGGSQLKQGTTKSCGCYWQDLHFIDLTGKRFGRLTVVKLKNKGVGKKTLWECKCDCGNMSICESYNLQHGHTTSCGCKARELAHNRQENLIGQTFGKLTVIDEAGIKYRDNRKNDRLWKCECECGMTTIARTNSLKFGQKTSCGCLISRGEYVITKYLSSHDIPYEPQKKFSDLVGVGGRQLSYDFFIPTYNLLVECQGSQHYRAIVRWGGDKGLEIRQEHDKRKREYAKMHNISLFEILEKDYDKADKILENKLLQLDQQSDVIG